MNSWTHLKGRDVVVTAGGVEYRGVVFELGQQALVLRAPGGFREIPWERVTKIEEETVSPGRGGTGTPPGW